MSTRYEGNFDPVQEFESSVEWREVMPPLDFVKTGQFDKDGRCYFARPFAIRFGLAADGSRLTTLAKFRFFVAVTEMFDAIELRELLPYCTCAHCVAPWLVRWLICGHCTGCVFGGNEWRVNVENARAARAKASAV